MSVRQNRWVNLAAGIIAELCIGIGYAWSVFQNPLVEKFGWTTSAVSMAFTLTTVMGTTTPFIGKLQEYIQTRTIVLMGAVVYGASLMATGHIHSILTLYLFYGVGVGLGTSMVYPLIISYMVKMFPEKRGLVSGLMVASYGCGAILWAPVGAYLASRYGVLDAFQILGIGMMILIAAASQFIGDSQVNPLQRKAGASPGFETAKDKTWHEMLRSPIFLVIFCAMAIGTTAGLMILGHASPIVQSTLKLPAQEAAFIVGILAASNAFGRLFWGGISDRVGRYIVFIILFVLCGGSLFALSASSLPAVFIAALIVIELCYGGYISLMAPIVAELFGVKHLSVNFGIMFIAFSIGGVIGPRLAAVVKEAHNGSYHQAYVIAMGMCIGGFILALFTAVYHRGHLARKRNLVHTVCDTGANTEWES